MDLDCGRLRRQAAGNIGISDIAGVASAHHRAERQRVQHIARGVGAAGSRLQAGILAHTTEAGLSTRALGVFGALRRRLFTLNGRTGSMNRIASETHWTDAGGSVVVHATLGVRSTGARTGILAPLIAAGQLVGALRIRDAFGSRAQSERIALVAGIAVTRGVMSVVRSTLGIVAALDAAARRNAIAIDARIAGRTVRVRSATHLEASAQSITSKARAAHAQRMVQLHVALGVGGARIGFGARIAALLLDAGSIVRAFIVAGAFGTGLRWCRFVTLHEALNVR